MFPQRPMTPTQQAFMGPPPITVPVTILSPKILFVTLSLDLVKLKPPDVETNKPAVKPNNPHGGRPAPPTPTPAATPTPTP
jgi:hypothetical protein